MVIKGTNRGEIVIRIRRIGVNEGESISRIRFYLKYAQEQVYPYNKKDVILREV